MRSNEFEAAMTAERRAYRRLDVLAQRFLDTVKPLWGAGDGHGGEIAEALARAAATLGLPMADWSPLRRADVRRLAARDGWCCHYCGRALGWGHASVVAPDVDHRQPISLGGSEELANKVLACGACNNAKGQQSHDAFCARCGNEIKQLLDSAVGSRTQSLRNDKTRSNVKDKSKSKVKDLPGDGVRVWESYRDAYERRYGVLPVRNRMINAILKHFVERVPGDEAPSIAAFYVRHSGAFYVRSGHAVQLLLRDAEKLRTEWITGRRISDTTARLQDETQHRGDQAQRVIERLRARHAKGA